jgi:LysM repeat protein
MFTIHSYVDDGVCFDAISPGRHAFHVREPRTAAAKGFRTTGQHGTRGDYDTIGIEAEDENPTSGDLLPGQAYGLSQETRITLLLRVRDYLRDFPYLTPEDVSEHATWDQWTRPHDLGDALNVLDFRDDLHDLRAGRTPWRTVGKHANGTRAVRATATVTVPPVAPVYTVRAGDTLGGVARAAGVTVEQLIEWNKIADPNVIAVGTVLRVAATPPWQPSVVLRLDAIAAAARRVAADAEAVAADAAATAATLRDAA